MDMKSEDSKSALPPSPKAVKADSLEERVTLLPSSNAKPGDAVLRQIGIGNCLEWISTLEAPQGLPEAENLTLTDTFFLYTSHSILVPGEEKRKNQGIQSFQAQC
ncbi:hypothetical protein SLEP1_g58315 [Rubroshorea leprosula]|uniref:Uncharacterized protein n=1 Tax=Rubroshorea leprosula TaxID=152421 RepID=A0AAV5MRQ3_9ROSI|nr:hypothetical protein SLEP1_g58315 [Rubroshorea leprosula]